MKTTKVVKYRTARECLAAFHRCRVSELPKHGYWVCVDSKGIKRRLTVKANREEIKRRGCWGWCEDKKVLHLWISRRAKLAEVIGLIAHEIGHCEKPYLRRAAEERKASKHEKVARNAAAVYQWFFDKRRRRVPKESYEGNGEELLP